MTGAGGSWSRHRLSEKEAVARLSFYGYEPLEPYPASRKPWRIRCLECLQPRTMLLHNLRSRCGHGVVGAGHRGRRLPDAVAEGEMRAAGWAPLEPYPGNTRAGWRCACTTCGRELRPSVERVRSRGGCAHGRRGPRPRRAAPDDHSGHRSGGLTEGED